MKLEERAREIFLHCVDVASGYKAVKRSVSLDGEKLKVGQKEYDLGHIRRILVIGAGKASAHMAQAIEEVLGGRIDGGIVNVKCGSRAPLRFVKINEAAHPVPDVAGLKGAREILELVSNLDEDDLVIMVLSGGGSALLLLPVDGIELQEAQELTRLLLKCGAKIDEINIIRKHISKIKGGQLARAVHPANLFTLILSDVVDDPLDVIASGPTVPDRSSFSECMEILLRYKLIERVPTSILNHLKDGVKGKIKETPKPGDPLFDRVYNFIVGNNSLAIQAAKEKAEDLGFNTLLLSSSIQGEAREVGKVWGAIIKEIRRRGEPISPPACLLAGGEMTVTVKGKGVGGRNQEFVLSCAIEIVGLERVVVLSGNTDGTDGPTPAAGALANGDTIKRAKGLGIDPIQYLENNDSYHFFKRLDSLLITGSTKTNVMDVMMAFVL
jgi:glycerate-2-kinase